jgi:hypothetical protein
MVLPNQHDIRNNLCRIELFPYQIRLLLEAVPIEVPASVISERNNLVQLPEFTRSTTLRWTLLVAGLFAGFIVALLGFVYLKAKADLTARSDYMIAAQMALFAQLSPDRRLDAIEEHLKQDPGPRSARRMVWPGRPQDRG